MSPILPKTVADKNMYFYTSATGNGSATHTAPAGFTEETDDNSGNCALATASKPITAAGSEQPTATWTGAADILHIAGVRVISVPLFYYYRIRTANSCGTSTNSNTITVNL